MQMKSRNHSVLKRPQCKLAKQGKAVEQRYFYLPGEGLVCWLAEVHKANIS